jgi:hypothetical protein
MAQKQQYESFLDQINGLKRVESLFDTFWQILDIVTAHSVMKCPQMPKWLSEGERLRKICC